MDKKTVLSEFGGPAWLISTAQAAKLLGLSTRTVQTLVHAEGFPSIRIGGRWLVDPIRLRNWIDDHVGGGVDIV